MKLSIKKFLLINLLLAITITTTLTAIGNYYLNQKDIQQHLDTLMVVSALSYQALLGDDRRHYSMSVVQKSLNLIPHKLEHYYKYNSLHMMSPKSYMNQFNFQVWDIYGKLLLHSAGASNLKDHISNIGFNDKIINNQKWRVFVAADDRTKFTTVLAEHYNTRKKLGYSIAQDDLYIMLLTFPLSGVLIWMIISRGLESLDKVAREVANRAPNNLEPVNLRGVPEEIKPVIDELNKLFNRLHNAFEREKRFASDAAHELRTPLAAIKAQAQVALNTRDLVEKELALQKLISNVNRGTHIVQQLLIMSRLVPEVAILNDLDEINLPKICREVLAMLAPLALERHIDIEFEHSGNFKGLEINSTAMSILLRNLVDNAIRYCQERGKITVRVYRKTQNMVLEVQDNGPGIHKDLHVRVFERFFRALGSKSQGSGLGLSIVKQITELHGGQIELDTPIESTGLIVRVYFPIK